MKKKRLKKTPVIYFLSPFLIVSSPVFMTERKGFTRIINLSVFIFLNL